MPTKRERESALKKVNAIKEFVSECGKPRRKASTPKKKAEKARPPNVAELAALRKKIPGYTYGSTNPTWGSGPSGV